MTITTGLLTRPDRPALAWRQVTDRAGGPTVIFLPGYASDMMGSKAQALFDWARARGRNCLLFDYAGCGASEGRFEDETLETWRDDVLDMIAARAPTGPLILVGSSMGGWLMLLVALALDPVPLLDDTGAAKDASPRGDRRITALIGIAAAPDFTDWGYTAEQKATLARDGRLYEDNPYGPDKTVTTLALWESGQRNRLLDAPITLDCPVRLLHGQADSDVPFTISVRLAQSLRSSDVQTLLVKSGDHRLSRAEDVDLLLATIGDLMDA